MHPWHHRESDIAVDAVVQEARRDDDTYIDIEILMVDIRESWWCLQTHDIKVETRGTMPMAVLRNDEQHNDKSTPIYSKKKQIT